MNRKPHTGFDPSSPLLRTVFAVAAVAATLATGGFIDALAHGYGAPGSLPGQGAPIVVARH